MTADKFKSNGVGNSDYTMTLFTKPPKITYYVIKHKFNIKHKNKILSSGAHFPINSGNFRDFFLRLLVLGKRATLY